ncbi:MAG: pyridoxamine 5'-phosphate oxidase family protein [Planctomycetaceae bacterium]|nr:pyridoxamine 5'-phosphate oxidase family protein [Planctomycetaceae bacterium]
MFEKVLHFLQENRVFYLATVEGNQPKVRPFGLAIAHEGRLYFGTSNDKAVYRQLVANPNFEVSACSSDMQWLRLRGKAKFENNMTVKKKAFELVPMLANIYQTPENPHFEVFYIAEAEGGFYSMANDNAPEMFKF